MAGGGHHGRLTGSKKGSGGCRSGPDSPQSDKRQAPFDQRGEGAVNINDLQDPGQASQKTEKP